MEHRIRLGCIADDFTGASDAASYVRQAGLSVILYNGVPSHDLTEQEIPQAAVIALKTRTEPAKVAVEQALEAARWLTENGASTIYFKYCSTFDSTKEGNIGPVMDVLLEEYDTKFSLLSPAFLENGRSVKQGLLYVGQELLENSSMRNHPLTPMTDSRLGVLMENQSHYKTHLFSEAIYSRRQEEVDEFLSNIKGGEERFYLIPDYYEEFHGRELVRIFGGLPVLSGGSGLVKALSEKIAEDAQALRNREEEKGQGTAVMLAGSCSKATMEQIKDFQEKGGISLAVHPIKLWEKAQTEAGIFEFLEAHVNQNVLIYTSMAPEALKLCKEQWHNLQPDTPLSEILEDLLARLAGKAVELGIRKIICAGGETSGAITKELGFQEFYIGESIAPGVPVLIPVRRKDIRLVLKSGNFGQKEFFELAAEC